MAATTAAATPLQEAYAKRNAEMDDHKEAYKEARRQTDQDFANAVRASGVPILKVASELGMNRQHLHRLLLSGSGTSS